MNVIRAGVIKYVNARLGNAKRADNKFKVKRERNNWKGVKVKFSALGGEEVAEAQRPRHHMAP